MLGIDARQLRAAPGFQTQAGRNCLATQNRDSEGAEGIGYRQSHMLLQNLLEILEISLPPNPISLPS